MKLNLFPIERRNTFLWHGLNSVTRSLILHGFAGSSSSNVVVNEYPKSGGSWFCQMLADVIDVPFPRNRLPMLKTCLMQCHAIRPFGMRNVVIVWRDGRDIAVSYYHYLLTGNEYSDARRIKRTCSSLGIHDPHDIERYLPRFIESLMECKVGPGFNWVDFVDQWHGRDNVLEVKYESLLIDAESELDRIASSLGYLPNPSLVTETVKKYSFKNQAGRDTGSEATGSFLRKGISGDWKNKFTLESQEVFNSYAVNALVKLGYQV